MTEKQKKAYYLLLELSPEFIIGLFINYFGTQILDDDFIQFILKEIN